MKEVLANYNTTSVAHDDGYSFTITQGAIPSDLTDEVIEIYQEGFEALDTGSFHRQSARPAELMTEMNNESVIKILMHHTASPVVGYMGIHTSLEGLSWLNQTGLAQVYGEAENNGNFFYNASWVLSEEYRSLRNAVTFLQVGTRLVSQLAFARCQSPPVIGFDYCKANDPGIPKLMIMALHREQMPQRPQVIGKHSAYLIEMAAKDDVRKNWHSSNGVSDISDKLFLGTIEEEFQLDNTNHIPLHCSEDTGIFIERVNEGSGYNLDTINLQGQLWALKNVGSALSKGSVGIDDLAEEIQETVDARADKILVELDAEHIDFLRRFVQKLQGHNNSEIIASEVDYQAYCSIGGY